MKVVNTEVKKTIYTLELEEDEVLALRIILGKQNGEKYKNNCDLSPHKDAEDLFERRGEKLFHDLYQSFLDIIGFSRKGDKE